MKRCLMVVGILAFAGCGEDPVAPRVEEPEPDPGPIVASVGVTSPIGPIMAVGGRVSLSAVAADVSGNPLTELFVWSSSDESVADVSQTGVLTGIAPGRTSVEAVAGGVTGRLDITIAASDLDAIDALLADPFADALLTSIGGDTEAALRAAWASCDTATTAGDLSSVSTCITQARTELADDESAHGPLRALVELFVHWIEAHLNLS